MPPPIPPSGAASWYSTGSQSGSARSSANRGLIASQASSGDAAPAIAVSASATNPRTTGVSRTNSTFFLGRGRQTLDRPKGALHLGLVEGDVLELACEVLVVGAHVEMAVTGEVEEDRALLARLVGLLRRLHRAVDRMRGLRGGEDSLAPCAEPGRGETVVLEVGLGADQVVAHEL